MKYIPILFSTPMVQAILDGRKTQTRRVVKPQPSHNVQWNGFGVSCFTPERHIEGRGKFPDGSGIKFFKCPYGQVGDILWVRETFKEAPEECTWKKYSYKADYISHLAELGKWKPSLFMPKEACRIFLKITDVRVERLQDISEEDAISEGITYPAGFSVEEDFPSLIFSELWESINGLESWDANPWVWVIEFERIERPLIFVSN